MSLPKVSRLIVGIGFLAACTRTEAPPKANIPERVATAPAPAEALRAPARSAVHVTDASASRRSLANANRSIAAIVREMRGPKKVGKSTERADVAFLAKSLATGEAVVSEDSQRLLSAASNTKLFTTAAALVRLGPDFRFETEFRSDAPVVDGTLQGDLWIVGGGDPTLTMEHGWCLDGAEGALARVAQELRNRGIARISGSLVLDDRLFTDARWHPGWPKRDRGKPHAIDISALCAEHHKIHVEADATDGKLEIFVTPRIQQMKLESTVKVVARGPAGITARLDGDTLSVGGTVVSGSSSATSLVSLEGARLFGAVALAAFAERGLSAAQGFRMPQNGETAARALLVKLQSAVPLSDVVRVTNQESDNLYADMILKVLGAKARGDGSFAGGVAAVRDVMRELGVPAAGYAAVDGSGLARDSKLSAAAIVALLEAMDRHPLGPVYKDSLAIGGRDGTLRKRFREPQVAGRVHAKTGSLDGVSALSGYVDSVSGEPFAFATLVNSEKGGSSKGDEDRIVRELAGIEAR